jgi:hypothetical protein
MDETVPRAWHTRLPGLLTDKPAFLWGKASAVPGHTKHAGFGAAAYRRIDEVLEQTISRWAPLDTL